MKKIRILGIAPYRGLSILMEQCSHLFPQIEIKAVVGNMEQGLEYAKRYGGSYDIIISRANTASMIAQETSIPVIDIGIDYYDILRCIKMAQSSGTKFALLGFHSLTAIAKNLCDLLKIRMDIFSFSDDNWKDSSELLDRMKEQGYRTVICDMIPYEHAKLIGITPIMLTSSVESVKLAFENAIRTWKQNEKLFASNTMMDRLIRSSSNQYLILDTNGACQYSTVDTELEDAFIEELKKELPRFENEIQRSFFITLRDQLYSIHASFSDEETVPYMIFCIRQSKIPMTHSKYGLTIMDQEQAFQSFTESFYSNTEAARSIIENTEALADVSVPLMITGEVGTGKDRIAYLYYAKSQSCNHPLYVINCAMLNDKTWNFITNHYNSPFTDNGNTIYIANLDALSHPRQKQLLSIIRDTNLHIRNRLFLSCIQDRNGNIPHAAVEYTNMLGCISIPIRPVREQPEDIVPSASFYLDTLNQDLGRQVVGLDEEAAELLKAYDYPCNRTQFKRILKKAVLSTSTAYISKETIREILEQESAFFPPSESHGISSADSHAICPHYTDNTAESDSFNLNLDQFLDSINHDIVMHVLKLCNNNQTAAAKRLGISRTTLWRYLNR